MKNVLVTGATGLVGSNLCKALVESGYKVRALVRKNSDKSFLDTLGVEYAYADLRDGEGVDRACKGIEKVFHCAAQIGGLKTYDDNHASINIQGTKNILEASVNNQVRKFIYVSTLGVLGIMKDHYNDNEDMPYIKVGMPYYDTKIDSERLVVNYYNDKKPACCDTQTRILYGERDRNGLPNLLPYLLKGQVFYVGSGNNDISLTSVKNLIQALLLYSEKDEGIGRIYNITDDQGITAKQFVKKLCQILSIPEPKVHIPVGVATGVAKAAHGTYSLLNKDTSLSEYTVALMSNNFHFDISRARKELSYNPSERFDEDLTSAINWYVKNNSSEVNRAKSEYKNIRMAFACFGGAIASLIIAKMLFKKKS